MTKAEHAVVVGNSFAGIVAARVLSDHFDRVTVIERDELPESPEPRKGVPQGGHVHGILKLGREVLDDLFPGFVEETQREGAILFDQIAWGAGWGSAGWSVARGPSQAMGYGVRRPLLELVARRRLLALPNVVLVKGRVVGLTAADGRITGVTVTAGDDGHDGHDGTAHGAGTRRVEADFVADASGRGSGAPGWLEKVGFEAPHDTIVNAFGGYASRLIRIPKEAWPDTVRFAAQLPSPKCTKGAIIYPQDNGLYIISLFGQSRDYPPGEEGAFDDFLRNCELPLLWQIYSQSEKLSEIRTSRATANRWRRYESLAEPPAGFVALGDAALAANPMFGQGISSACLGAVTLGQTLTDLSGNVDGMPKEFFARQAARLQFPWQLAIGYDLQFPETVGERSKPTPETLERARYMAALAQLATEDRAVNEALLLAPQMYDPTLLFAPEIRAKVEAWIADGRTPRFTDPSTPPWEAVA